MEHVSTSARLLAIVFSAVVGAFLIATVATQQASTQVDALSDEIITESMPSVVRLASVRGRVLEVELALARYVQAAPHRRRARAPRLERAMAELDENVQGYLELGLVPGEQRHWNRVHQAWARFDETARRARTLTDAGDDAHAMSLVEDAVEPSGDRVIGAAIRAIDFNARYVRGAAERIQEIRRRTMWLSYGLTAICMLLAIAGGLLIHRQARSRRAVAEAHFHAIETRAEELEQFAGRVAHDLRNPLSAIGMATQLVQDSPDQEVRWTVERIGRSVARANALIAGLLDFARSGAAPDPGAHCDPSEVLADVIASLAEETSRARIEIRIEPVPPARVACSTGVYLSLVSNLLRNAIKYMGDPEVRRITVRVVERASIVRTEVADTGRGIARENLPLLFEPYFRAGAAGREGLGLGLATVKKLAEGHHGRAGVESEPGRGSCFWFELPRAGSVRTSFELQPSRR